MIKKVDSEEYIDAMLSAMRAGTEKVCAFYEHRIGLVCTDPKLMLMPWDDHLVHRGDGVFESMKFVDGKMYQLDPHLRRMKRSARSIHLEPPCSWKEMADIILEVAGASGCDSGMVRVLLGRGGGGFGIDLNECPVPSLYIVIYKYEPKPEEWYEKGLTAFKTSIPAKQPYLATIKSIDYLPNVLMKREATEKGFNLPFCFDSMSFLAEGATENVCIVNTAGTILVPQFTNALAGTTLTRAIQLIADEVEVDYVAISEDDILMAKEVIVCGTSIDTVGVVRYNKKPIHDVRPGPVCKRMRELLQKDLQETGTPIIKN
ncbi:aminotransferase class IV [Maridesulfovibrio hydrothermalis]|uniref:Aminotransferase class IV n=1 Tax=Maridesulfovibrio hydrothermalis AM13 = DSM 14728 TaxID=1121451 RepID=L0RF61_9BACT|nr:aminotransferase class IV [Maridesulfovibrio hydrothermalis]CCO24206.1 Aminotransferase class IV [Maridesulfovibrio hydrothermalis AM13 = DSM 14728]